MEVSPHEFTMLSGCDLTPTMNTNTTWPPSDFTCHMAAVTRLGRSAVSYHCRLGSVQTDLKLFDSSKKNKSQVLSVYKTFTMLL
jgi:hypothetical protein